MSQELINMTIPACPTYARSVRMMAASLAVVCGMNVDEVEDIRMAAEEGFVYACHAEGNLCEIEFNVKEDGIEIDFVNEGSVEDSDEISLQYSSLLLEAVCDEYSIVDDEEKISIHLIKNSGGVYGK